MMSKMYWMRLLIFIIILALIEYYSFIAIRFAVKEVHSPYKQLLIGLYIALTLTWFGLLFMVPMMRHGDFDKTLRNVIISFALGFLLTKLIIAVILLIDDLRRGGYFFASLFSAKDGISPAIESGMTRSDFIAKCALLFGGTVFATILYGMSNRYNYHVKKIKLNYDNLPSSFKGLRIVQISDIHSGSFNDTLAVQKGIDMILAQKPDVIFFTGDLVNNKSEEMLDYMSIFSKLNAPLGVYSILGNHDYGDYVEWQSAEEKLNNLNQLKEIHAKMGWRLLLNEHVLLQKEDETIAVIGVENISFRNRFHSYGDLKTAYDGAQNHAFKILLSHDPSHWDGEVNSKYADIDLTLSGHTHGAQFGIEIPGLKWSPIQYMYKQWAGVYQNEKQYLYVNRGFGFLGYPGRVGILPEITVIDLA